MVHVPKDIDSNTFHCCALDLFCSIILCVRWLIMRTIEHSISSQMGQHATSEVSSTTALLTQLDLFSKLACYDDVSSDDEDDAPV